MSFSLQACAVPAGIGETVVVDWLEDELAVGGLIAAYGLYDAVPPLLTSLSVPERHLYLAALGLASASRFHDLTVRRTGVIPWPSMRRVPGLALSSFRATMRGNKADEQPATPHRWRRSTPTTREPPSSCGWRSLSMRPATSLWGAALRRSLIAGVNAIRCRRSTLRAARNRPSRPPTEGASAMTIVMTNDGGQSAASRPADSGGFDTVAAVVALRKHPDYRMLRPIVETTLLVHPASVGATRVGIVIDVETEGLDPVDNAIVELAARRFRFDAAGRIVEVGRSRVCREDPGRPLSPTIARLTGLTDADLAGQTLDDRAVVAMLAMADVVISHNAKFDRPRIEARHPGAAGRAWAC